jgi:hypothetical protein
MGNETQESTPAPVLLASLRAPTPNARVHALPCTIEHDGPAAIRTYFMPRKVDQGQAQDKTDKKEKATSTSGDVKGVCACVCLCRKSGGGGGVCVWFLV